MAIVGIGRLLAGTALGVVLALSGQNAYAQSPSAEPQINLPLPDVDSADKFRFGETGKPADVAPQTQPAKSKPAETAATPVAPTEAAAATGSDNSAIADKLRETLTAKLDRAGLRRNERMGAEAFYKERNYAPLWTDNGTPNARAKAAIAYLSQVDKDGLDPAEYPAPDFKSAVDAQGIADAEAQLTASVLTYARHALRGRVAYSRVASDIYFDNPAPEANDILATLSKASDTAVVLDSFEPQHKYYQGLKKALADARGGKIAKEPEKVEDKSAEDRVKIAEGQILRRGMKDARVPALRKRLNVDGDKSSTVYDEAVWTAVKGFQAQADLKDDGNLGNHTVRALNGATPAAAQAPKLGDPTDTIIVNLDRWRWYARELGNTNVVVNIPDFRLTLNDSGKVYWTTKIVVGKPNLPTPLITAEMKFITVNPTWNVPPSIIEKEYLPALQEDPGALERIGLKLEQHADGTVRIWQPPGAGNALGRIRFNFPNKFLVYQHDTPDKHLFKHDKRAYSHGCMRVENPLLYGEKLLSLVLPNENYTSARLEKMFGGSEININFPESKHIKVHLTYQTAFVDDEGKLQLREDVYGRDARMIQALKGSERKVADIAVDRPANTSAKPVRMTPGQYGGPSGGGNFFDWIFGGPRGTPIRAERRQGRVSSR
ncbi:MAG: L,D-transpeptidase family protein [Pseudolabrys sp.]|nr:L,D-transpeptidase family protein [Pseudolabrys sp.]